MKKILHLLAFLVLAATCPAQIQNMQAASGTTGDLTKPTGGFSLASGQIVNFKTGSFLTLPTGTAPATTVFGRLAADSDAWGASRGALQFFDGTANTYVVATLASSTPADGKVPTWHTGGTVTWDTAGVGTIAGTTGATDKAITRANGTGGATLQGSTATLSDDALLTLPQTLLAANTSGDGTILSNSTAATVGNQRFSPRLRLTGNGWKTTATAGSQVVDWIAETQPVQGAANPTAQLVFSSQINGAGYTPRVVLDSGGTIYLGASATAPSIANSSGSITLAAAGTNQNINLNTSGTGYVNIPAVTNNTTARMGGVVIQTYATNNNSFGDNIVYDGTNTNYIVTGFAAYVQFNGGSIQFRTAPSGTGGAAATVTTRMQLSNAGVLSLSTNTASTSTATGTITNAGGLGNVGAIFGGDKIVSVGPTSGVGYATGAGGTVTQATSRTTGVALNTVTGAVTLVSAAGSATPATFTVTDSAVAATDVVVVSQKSGTDLYEIFVTNVAAGSFKITSFTTGGTTTEQPVFNFAVIKGSAN